MFSLHIGHERVVAVVVDSRSSSVPERESWSGDWELPESVRRGLRPSDLFWSPREEGFVAGSGDSPPNTRRGARGAGG
jgi:hypothetical protein